MSPPNKPEFPPLLLPGFHPMSLKDIKRRFVDPFTLSHTRKDILVGLTAVVQRLVSVGVVGHLWVDGSFVTEKIDPEDADLVLRLNDDFTSSVTAEQDAALRWFAEEDLKSLHHCDCYIWVDCPCDTDDFMESDWSRAYWIRQFGFSRAGVRKGMAVLELPDGAL